MIDPNSKLSAFKEVRNGLSGHIILIRGEDVAAYEAEIKRFFDDFNPQGPVEEHYVQGLIDSAWRLNRIRAIEINLLALDAGGISASTLSALNIHEQHLTQRFVASRKQLVKLQADRRKQEKSQMASFLRMTKAHPLVQ